MERFLEKIRLLKKLEEEEEVNQYKGPYTIDIRYRDPRWGVTELPRLKLNFSWLPISYFKFLKEFDSLGLCWVTFFGSSKSNIMPVWREIKFYKNNLKDEYFPFGKDVDGSIYAFNKACEVIYFDESDPDWETPIFIASSFEDFVDQCILGPRYEEFNDSEGDTFYDFMKKQGWV